MSRITRIIRDVDVTRPNTPTGFSATPVTETQINLSWNAASDPQGSPSEANTGVVGYKLYRDGVLRVTQAGLTYSDTGLSAYTSYSYRVSSYDGAGNESVQSTAITPRTLDSTAPSAPVITATALSSSSISVALTTPSSDSGSGVATYALEYKRNIDSTWTVFGAALTAAQFPATIGSLSASTLYDTRCRATDVVGNVGSYSTTNQATTTAAVLTSKKWYPGHYMLCQGGDQNSTSTIASRFTEISTEANIKGAVLRVNWNKIEGDTLGSYTWTLLDFIRDQATAAGKKWMILLIDRDFGGVDASTAPVPAYVKNLTGTNLGVALYDNGSIARIWRADVMDRLMAVHNAVYDRYDSDTSFQGTITEESAIAYNSTTPPLDFSNSNLGTQLRRLQTGVASHARSSIFFSSLNYMSSDPNMLSTVQGVIDPLNGGQGISGPDICVNPSSGAVPVTGYTTAQQMWVGTIGASTTPASDFRGKAATAFQAQSGGTRQHTFQEIYDGAVAYGNTHMVWEHAEPASGANGYGCRWSLVKSNLATGSFNGYRTAYPPSYPGQPPFALAIHSSGRYLTVNGSPFLLQGDTPWSLPSQLTNAQIDTYLNDRAAKGYTAILFNAPEKHFTSQTPEYNNVDGVPPFANSTGNFGVSPNAAYWNRVDYIVNQAKALNIVCIINPAYSGSNNAEGWNSELGAQSAANLQAYGVFLANRYTQGNVIWCMGGDLSGTSTSRSKQFNIMTGILSVRPTEMWTAHGDANTSAFSAGWSSLVGSGTFVNSNYCYPEAGFETYQMAATEYARSPIRPFFQLETRYEQENSVGAAQLRRQSYQVLAAGACGQLFGNNPIWHFESPNTIFPYSGTWQSNLNSTGNQQQAILSAFVLSYQWWKLAPSTGTALVTTALGSGSSRICPALASDGSFAWVWKNASGAITINKAALAPAWIRARFFDPTTGAYSAVTGSPFAHTGTQSITFPGERMLVLDGIRADQLSNSPLTMTTDEGTSATITVTSAQAFTSDTLIPFTLTPLGGAVAGVDYTVPTSPLTLLAGSTSVSLVIPILTDAITDPGESIRVDWGTVTPSAI